MGKVGLSVCPAGYQQHCMRSATCCTSMNVQFGVAGVLHNDLKPENIFLARKHDLAPDNLVIGDLGLANTLEHYTDNWDEAGTPGWMAPEANGLYSVHSPKSDVFSLGAILYFMVTGSAPFKSDLGTYCLSSKAASFSIKLLQVQHLCMHKSNGCRLLRLL